MASYFAVQVRIADEVQKNLNIAAWLREALENELGASFGVGKDGSPPKCGVDNKAVQKWRDVVKEMEALTVAKIRLDKNAKQMADQMSPEEELEAVRSYIRSLEPTLRSEFLRKEKQWHDDSVK
jgi:hypothetical protein